MSKRARIVLGVLIAITIVAGVGVTIGLRNLEPRLRDWIAANLERSLESKVELGSVHLTWMPLRVHVPDDRAGGASVASYPRAG